MKYTKMLMNMVNELREQGLHVSYIDNGALVTDGSVDNHYYFETGSTINIYKNYALEASYKTKKSAMNFLSKN